LSDNTLLNLDFLNSSQQEAVKAIEGPVLVLAGAGSGKTRVLTSRITYMIKNMGIDPANILSMTFTNKAAKEMKLRVAKNVESCDRMWIGTFHSIFAKILRYEAAEFGYSSDFVIYDSDDQVRLIKSIMKDFQISHQLYNPKSINAAISNAKNQLITPDSLARDTTTALKEVVARIFPEYESRLRINHAFDFDDLITVPIELFAKNPHVLQKYQDRFKYILVDEYQDTNRAQYMLLKRLSEKTKNIFAVGDDDQSIYRWRGADIRNILEFEKDYPQARVFRLEQNYRSTKTILNGANSVVKNNTGRKGKTLWSEGSTGEKIDVLQVENERLEAQKVISKIQFEMTQNRRSFRDFVILYRTNAQSRVIEDSLRRNGLAYIIVGGMRFYDRKEIKDILAYLKVIANPRDSISLKRIINFPLRGIGDKSIEKLEMFSSENSLLLFEGTGQIENAPGITDRTKNNIKSFHNFVKKYIDLKEKITLNELVHTLVDEAGLLLMYKEDTSIEGQGRADNIKEFLAAIDDYCTNTEDASLSGFLEEVSLISDVDQWNDSSNVITLMTLHCAKGLEFPVVFMVGLEDGLFPGFRSLDDEESMEEERRLMYVGMTRAMEKLYLLHAGSRRLYNDSRPSIPSRFLEEIDSSCLKKSSTIRKVRQKSSFSARTAPDKYSNSFASDPMPDYESFSQEETSVKKGVWIAHAKFGRGKVKLVSGKGPKQVINILFENGLEKKFIAKFAKFEILG